MYVEHYKEATRRLQPLVLTRWTSPQPSRAQAQGQGQKQEHFRVPAVQETNEAHLSERAKGLARRNEQQQQNYHRFRRQYEDPAGPRDKRTRRKNIGRSLQGPEGAPATDAPIASDAKNLRRPGDHLRETPGPYGNGGGTPLPEPLAANATETEITVLMAEAEDNEKHRIGKLHAKSNYIFVIETSKFCSEAKSLALMLLKSLLLNAQNPTERPGHSRLLDSLTRPSKTRSLASRI